MGGAMPILVRGGSWGTVGGHGDGCGRAP
jgi:hypothetical protein